MNARKTTRELRWYKMIGHPIDDEEKSIIAIVQSTSRRKVMRYHGGRRKEALPNGDKIVQFPTHPGQIQLLGKNLKPERLLSDADAIVEVIPVTRYQCECGKVHVSEHPYPSMWCSCGKKARPVNVGAGNQIGSVWFGCSLY